MSAELAPTIGTADALPTVRLANKILTSHFRPDLPAGRLLQFFHLTNPLLLGKMPLRGYPTEAMARLRDRGAAGSVSDAVLVSACVHPDTGSLTPIAFRLPAFVPVNVFICAGMLSPNLGTVPLVAFQAINQMYNVALTYSQRNASTSEITPSQILAYGSLAVSAAGGVTIAGRALSARLAKATTLAPSILSFSRMMTPVLSVALGNVAMTYSIRQQEIKEGIRVQDEAGDDISPTPSQAAARRAVGQTALSKVVLCFPPLLFPQLGNYLLTKKVAAIAARPALHSPINLALITAGLWVGLPVAVSVFPQRGSLPVAELEDDLKAVCVERGIDRVFFNKGL
jgi:hypothetical protein